MRNILSYQYGTIFTGKEVNDFIKYNIDNNTSHKKDSIRLMKQFIFKDDCYYCSARTQSSRCSLIYFLEDIEIVS